MPSCCVPGCLSNTNGTARLFRFPKDEERRKLWAEVCGKTNWSPTDYSRICEVHFHDSQFEQQRKDGKRLLKWYAIPTKFGNTNKTTSHVRRLKKKACNVDSDLECTTERRPNPLDSTNNTLQDEDINLMLTNVKTSTQDTCKPFEKARVRPRNEEEQGKGGSEKVQPSAIKRVKLDETEELEGELTHIKKEIRRLLKEANVGDDSDVFDPKPKPQKPPKPKSIYRPQARFLVSRYPHIFSKRVEKLKLMKAARLAKEANSPSATSQSPKLIESSQVAGTSSVAPSTPLKSAKLVTTSEDVSIDKTVTDFSNESSPEEKTRVSPRTKKSLNHNQGVFKTSSQSGSQLSGSSIRSENAVKRDLTPRATNSPSPTHHIPSSLLKQSKLLRRPNLPSRTNDNVGLPVQNSSKNRTDSFRSALPPKNVNSLLFLGQKRTEMEIYHTVTETNKAHSEFPPAVMETSNGSLINQQKRPTDANKSSTVASVSQLSRTVQMSNSDEPVKRITKVITSSQTQVSDKNELKISLPETENAQLRKNVQINETQISVTRVKAPPKQTINQGESAKPWRFSGSVRTSTMDETCRLLKLAKTAVSAETSTASRIKKLLAAKFGVEENVFDNDPDVKILVVENKEADRKKMMVDASVQTSWNCLGEISALSTRIIRLKAQLAKKDEEIRELEENLTATLQSRKIVMVQSGDDSTTTTCLVIKETSDEDPT